MVIAAHNPVNPRKQRLRTPQLVIVELILEELPYRLGTAGDLLQISLGSNYQAAPHRICHEMIDFEISSGKALTKHSARVASLVRQLQKGYVLPSTCFHSN
jgi:hypothetical protein